MALEIVGSGPVAQNNALSMLMNTLRSGGQAGAFLKSISAQPSGEIKLNLNIAGQMVELGASKEAAAQLTAGQSVVLRLAQTPQGPQLTVRPADANTGYPKEAVNAAKGGPLPGQETPLRAQGALSQAAARTQTNFSGNATNTVTLTSYGDRPAQTVQANQTAAIQAAQASQAGQAIQTGQAPAGSPLSEALVSLQRQAMAQQQSLTDVFANVTALLQQVEAGQRPNVSRDLEVALRWVLGFQLPSKQLDGSQKSGEFLRQAIASLGLLREPSSGAQTKEISGNLKAALGLLLALLPDGEQEELPPVIARRDRPPLKGTELQGQGPQSPTIKPSDSDALALSLIRRSVESALARVILTQIASTGGSAREGGQPGGPALPTLHAEIPVALPNGTAVVQMTIQQEPFEKEVDDNLEEDQGEKGPKGRGGWVVQFAVDTEPVGSVDVSVRLREEIVRITLSAERQETLALFRKTAPDLQTMLEAEGLTLDGLLISDKKTQDTSPNDDDVPTNPARLDRML